jgi:subtilisin family serine protease
MFRFRFCAPFVSLLLGLMCAATFPQPARGATEPAFVPGEVLVKFRAGSALTQRRATVAAMGHSRLKTVDPDALVQRLRIGTDQDPRAVAAAYRDRAQVEWAEPNYLCHLNAVPDDPDYDQLWGLNNTGQTVRDATYATHNPGIAGRDMDMEAAWDEITDCRNVVVAVIDTGVNYTHRDLAANMWDGGEEFPYHGYDVVDEDNDPMPADGVGHGSHVAGTIAAVGNNGLGVTGVCWQAQIMAVRAGAGNSLTHADIAEGTYFAVDHGADVLNMSFGGPTSLTIEAALTYAHDAGVVIVTSAGNSSADNDRTPQYPCASDLDNLVCVAALDQAYALASFSNYGLTTVDVGAPGTNILSTLPGPALADDFSSGWTRTGDWSLVSADLGSGAKPTLANPADALIGGSYANNIDDRVYKSFDLRGYIGASLSAKCFYQTESGHDYFGIASSDTEADPFDDPDNNLAQYSGYSGSDGTWRYLVLNDCLNANCAVGFQLTSDASTTYSGVAVQRFTIETAIENSTAQTIYNGTSMSSPHVVGLTALIWAYNPQFTYLDVIRAITEGGDSLAALQGKTVSGKAVDAMGSLQYIQAPTGLTPSLP